jgi:hypothetical protein
MLSPLPDSLNCALLARALTKQRVDARQLSDRRRMAGGQRLGAMRDVERQPDRDIGGAETIERLRLGQRDRALDEAREPIALEEMVQSGGLVRDLCAGIGLGCDPQATTTYLPAAGLDAQRRTGGLDLDGPHAARADQHEIEIVCTIRQLKIAVDCPAIIERCAQLLGSAILAGATSAIVLPDAIAPTGKPRQPDPQPNVGDQRKRCKRAGLAAQLQND